MDIDNKFYLASKETALNDPMYRYQVEMPKITIGGKQGNRTTYFENSEVFADYIKLPSIYFAKYIGNKISCPSSFDKLKNCITFKGDYQGEIIIQHLMDFIKIYVLCYNCDYPEIDLSLNSKKDICKICRSCGEINIIPGKNMDKTYDFIKKNIVI